MGQEAREQSRAGYDNQAKLLQKGEGVELEPVLRDSSIDEAVQLQAGEGDSPVSRWKPLKLPSVGAFKVDTLCDKVPFTHRILHGEAKIGETVNESGKEPGPGLGVQRRSLQTRGSVGNVMGPTDVGLRRIVALVEHLDPAAALLCSTDVVPLGSVCSPVVVSGFDSLVTL